MLTQLQKQQQQQQQQWQMQQQWSEHSSERERERERVCDSNIIKYIALKWYTYTRANDQCKDILQKVICSPHYGSKVACITSAINCINCCGKSCLCVCNYLQVRQMANHLNWLLHDLQNLERGREKERFLSGQSSSKWPTW